MYFLSASVSFNYTPAFEMFMKKKTNRPCSLIQTKPGQMVAHRSTFNPTSLFSNYYFAVMTKRQKAKGTSHAEVYSDLFPCVLAGKTPTIFSLYLLHQPSRRSLSNDVVWLKGKVHPEINLVVTEADKF